jgi:hypothetical protein
MNIVENNLVKILVTVLYYRNKLYEHAERMKDL